MKEILAALRAAGEATEDQESLDFAAAKEEDVLPLLAELQAEYTASGRAYQIVEQVNGWTFATDPRTGRWVRQLYPEAKPTRSAGSAGNARDHRLSTAGDRADVEAVRGVAVDGVMQVLLDRSLVKIAGRAEVPGRPLLYRRPNTSCSTSD
jgi:segregation and condensation protein B